MNYQQTLDYIFNLHNFEKQGSFPRKLDLSNMREVAEKLNNPQGQYNTIHIAGTNGKGSTAHIISAILQTSGYRVGLYTSPHLLDFAERIKINGTQITQGYVRDFVSQNKTNIEEYNLSFFERATLMAFQYFRDQKVDIAIIETGLGGRLDATNIIYPILSVITNIELEHTEILGSTISEITREKGGIIKENTPIIIRDTNVEVIRTITEMANQKNAPLIKVQNPDKDDYESCDLKGDYQIHNIATAITTAKQLHSKRYNITQSNIEEAIPNVRKLTNFVGRWQTILNNPKIIVDVAHNPAGIESLNDDIKKLAEKTLTIIFGALKGKDTAKMLDKLPVNDNTTIILTQPKTERALPIENLIAIWETVDQKKDRCKVVTSATVVEAIDMALKMNKQTTLILGSNYTVAEAYIYLNK